MLASQEAILVLWWQGRVEPEVLYCWRRLAALDAELGRAVASVLERRHPLPPAPETQVGYRTEVIGRG